MALSTETLRSFRLYVTHVDGDGHFLKISGQLDQQASLMIEALFETSRESLEKGIGAVSPGSIQEGIICAAKYKDGTYYRAKIINMTNIATGLVGVHFIDFGNKDIISLSTIRLLDNYDPMLLQLRGQATDYYLSRVINPTGRWEEPILMKLQSLLCYQDYQVTLDVQTLSLPLVSIQFKGNDLATHLVSIRFGMAIPLPKQEVLLLQVSDTHPASNWQSNYSNEALAFSEHVPFVLNQNFPGNPASAMRLQQHVALPFNGSVPTTPSLLDNRLRSQKVSRTAVNIKAPTRHPQQAPGTGAVLTTPPPATQVPFSAAKPASPNKSTTYKSKLLEMNAQYRVFVSYAEEGPELFAVQLVSESERLQVMMDEINRRPHRSLAEPPMIGTVCLGRMSGDRIICRAIVMNLSGSQCKLFFVDFGDTEMVSYYDIFDIPEEFVKPNVFAMRFCLSGVKKLEKGPHLREAFKRVASGKVLTLKVVPPEGPPLIQYGELYLERQSVLDLVAAELQRQEPRLLEACALAPGSRHAALVSYVDSCLKFYIQVAERIDELTAVMEAVRTHCEGSSPPAPGALAPGAACCARFPEDGKWYRARVLAVEGEGARATVLYVDYGNEQEVDAADLRPIAHHLCRLPAVAVKCALKGFEDRPVESKTSNQLEMLALEKTLQVHVVGVLPGDTLLVTLVDETVAPPLDVARKMNQLSQPRSSHEGKAPLRREGVEVAEGGEEGGRRAPRPDRPREERPHQHHASAPVPPRERGGKERAGPGPGPGDHSARSRGGSFRVRESGERARHGAPDRASRADGRPERTDTRPERTDTRHERTDARPERNDTRHERNDARHERNDTRHERTDTRHERDDARHERTDARHERADTRLERADTRYERTDTRYERADTRHERTNTRPDRRAAPPAPAPAPAPAGDDEWEESPAPHYSRDRRSPRGGARGDRRPGRARSPPPRAGDRPTRDTGGRGRGARGGARGARGGAREARGGARDEAAPGRELPAPVPPETPFARPEVAPGARQEVEVTWLVSPDKLYVQPAALQPAFRDMMLEIPALYAGVRPYRGALAPGASVLARYPADGALYRATVLEHAPHTTLVHYVDFGNKAAVGARDLWQLDRRLMELPALAVPCALADVAPAGDQWRTGDELDACFGATRYEAVFEEGGEGCYRVQLWHDGASVADRLRAAGLAAPAAPPAHDHLAVKDEPIELTVVVGQRLVCRVTHVAGHDHVALHLDLEKVARVEEIVAGYPLDQLRPPAPELVAVGAHCTVRHEGRVYRAVLQHVGPEHVTALLADYGNELTTARDNVMVLPPELSAHYYQAVVCRLAGARPLLAPAELAALLLHNTYIAHVHRLDELTPVVTLYSVESGARVPACEEGATRVVPLCPRPVLTHACGAHYLAHGAALHALYLHRALDTPALARLLDDLYTAMEPGCAEGEEAAWEAGALCAARSADGNWYRAEVGEAVEGGAELTVHYLDYGNTEVVPRGAVRALPPAFHHPARLALRVSLGLEPARGDALDTLLQWAADGELDVTVSRALDQDTWLATLQRDGSDLGARLVSEGLAAPQDAPAPAPGPAPGPPTGCVPMYVSHVDSPGLFWLQPADCVDEVEQLQARLADEAPSYEELEAREPGARCAARYSHDDRWYRALVLDVDKDIVTVRFLDYGNTDVLDNTPDALRALPAELDARAPAALRASLDAVPGGTGEWSERATERFQELVDGEEPVHVRVVLQLEDALYADVFPAGAAEHAARALEREGLCVCSAPHERELPACFASHVTSPAEFWLQLEASTGELQAMEAAMERADTFPELAAREEGAPCAARYPEDGLWYRAQVVVTGSEGTEVLFMDYGNACIAHELRALPAELAARPALARKCALQRPRAVPAWSRAAHQRFTDLAAEGATVFRAHFVASGDVSIVELYVDGHSVTDQLAELCQAEPADERHAEPATECDVESVTVSHVESPDEVYVQRTSALEELDRVAEALAAAHEWEPPGTLAVGALCAAHWAEDERWYRARVLQLEVGAHTVHFIDYGNNAPCTEFRSLPPELAALRPLADRCRVPVPEELRAAAHDLLTQLAADGATLHARRLHGDAVDLSLEGRPLRELLGAPLAASSELDEAEEPRADLDGSYDSTDTVIENVSPPTATPAPPPLDSRTETNTDRTTENEMPDEATKETDEDPEIKSAEMTENKIAETEKQIAEETDKETTEEVENETAERTEKETAETETETAEEMESETAEKTEKETAEEEENEKMEKETAETEKETAEEKENEKMEKETAETEKETAEKSEKETAEFIEKGNVDVTEKEKVEVTRKQTVEEKEKENCGEDAEKETADMTTKETAEMTEKDTTDVTKETADVTEKETADVTAKETAEMTEKETAKVARKEIADMTEKEIAGMTEKEIADMTEKEIADMTEKEIAEMTEKEIADMTEKEICGLTEKETVEQILKSKVKTEVTTDDSVTDAIK